MRSQLVGLSILIAAVATAATGQSLVVTAALWFVTPVALRLLLMCVLYCRQFSRAASVPMQIKYSVHRLDEFFLLMAGEGVISISNEPLSSSADFLSTFFLSYFLLSAICMLHFSTSPHDADHHALRRSSFRGFMWDFLQKSSCFFLISCASGFRIILKNVVPGHSVDPNGAWLLCGSTTLLLLHILVSRVLHHGLTEEFVLLHESSLRVKIALWVAKLTTSCIILAGPAMNAPAWALLLFVTGCSMLTFLIQVIDLRTFRDHHLKHISMEVANRRKKYGLDKSPASTSQDENPENTDMKGTKKDKDVAPEQAVIADAILAGT